MEDWWGWRGDEEGGSCVRSVCFFLSCGTCKMCVYVVALVENMEVLSKGLLKRVGAGGISRWTTGRVKRRFGGMDCKTKISVRYQTQFQHHRFCSIRRLPIVWRKSLCKKMM